MLPDLPNSKRELEQYIFLRLHAAIKERNVLARHSKSIVQHEGDRMAHDQITREGKRIVESEYERAEAGIMVPIEEVPTMVGPKLIEKLDQMADDIASQTSRSGYKKLDEVLTETGAGIDAGGKPLDAEMYLQALEGMEINFDPETLQPTFVIVIHPDLTPAMMKVKDTVENDPNFKRRYDDLIARKLKDWRDRESNRRLVD
ncbi:MAG TPA: hypothetical protein VJN64_00285 [Terriglobales bacterium]|nr:hypothetical protein [Terriglobales bacterium]